MRDLVTHIEQAAEILDGRLRLFQTRFRGQMAQDVAAAHDELAYDANFLVQAVSRLRPLVEKGTPSAPHPT
jgi:hypothetical protein